MRRHAWTAGLWVAAGLAAIGQQAFQAERRQYEDAVRDWRQADSGLSAEADAAPPAMVQARVRDAESKRSALEAAKARWLSAVRARYGGVPSASGASGRTDVPTRAAIVSEVLNELTGDANTIAQELKPGSGADAGRIAALRRQRDELEPLRRLFADRQKALERMAALNAAIDRQRAAVEESRKRMVAAIAAEQDRAQAEKAEWGARYEGLRRKAAERAAAEAARAAAAVSTPVAVASEPSVGRARDLTGKWVLSNPRLEKFADAAGPLYGDVSVTVEITQAADRVTGSYHGMVFVPPNERYNPNVDFRFSGPAGSASAVFEGNIESPLSGVIRIEWSGENEIRVTYKVDRTPAASRVSFKEGGVKVLRR